MPLLIDTYNVLHQTGVLPPDLAGIEVEGLIELLRSSRYRSQRVTLVCDGQADKTADARTSSLIAVRYAGKGFTADELIGRMIVKSSAPRRLLVITSDRAVRRAARKRSCAVLSSEGFLKHLAFDAQAGERAGRGKNRSASSKRGDDHLPADAAHWAAQFNLTRKELSASTKTTPAKKTPKKLPASKSPPTSAADDDRSPPLAPRTSPDAFPHDIIEQAERLWSQKKTLR